MKTSKLQIGKNKCQKYGASGLVMAGKANMNPAYVIIHQENDKVMVMATAKEGLIKQHTAAGAIGKIRQLI